MELLHRHLDQAGIPHAFGGALALAYCTQEPRATADIDLNVFVAPARARDVFEALPAGVTATDEHASRVLRDGQVRLRWEETPVDLFFAYHAFHEDASARVRVVRFAATEIPVLDCGDLVVFKAIFGRPQDWVDIEKVLEAGATELEDPLERLQALLGPDDPACTRLASIGAPTLDEDEPYKRVFGSPSEASRNDTSR